MAFYGAGFNSGKFGYAATEKVGGKWVNIKRYTVWSSMIKRCYNEEFAVYDDVTVHPCWHDYQDFAKWWEGQPEHQKKENWQLDKDIIDRDARVYSPSTCRLVPTQINLLIKKMADRGCVQGVNYHKRDKAFRAFVVDASGKHLEKNGFKTELDAFLWHKKEKEIIVKELAEKYKAVIDLDVYNTLINYKVVSERFIDVS
jgi:hypothetical protein